MVLLRACSVSDVMKAFAHADTEPAVPQRAAHRVEEVVREPFFVLVRVWNVRGIIVRQHLRRLSTASEYGHMGGSGTSVSWTGTSDVKCIAPTREICVQRQTFQESLHPSWNP